MKIRYSWILVLLFVSWNQVMGEGQKQEFFPICDLSKFRFICQPVLVKEKEIQIIYSLETITFLLMSPAQAKEYNIPFPLPGGGEYELEIEYELKGNPTQYPLFTVRILIQLENETGRPEQIEETILRCEEKEEKSRIVKNWKITGAVKQSFIKIAFPKLDPPDFPFSFKITHFLLKLRGNLIINQHEKKVDFYLSPFETLMKEKIFPPSIKEGCWGYISEQLPILELSLATYLGLRKIIFRWNPSSFWLYESYFDEDRLMMLLKRLEQWGGEIGIVFDWSISPVWWDATREGIWSCLNPRWEWYVRKSYQLFVKQIDQRKNLKSKIQVLWIRIPWIWDREIVSWITKDLAKWGPQQSWIRYFQNKDVSQNGHGVVGGPFNHVARKKLGPFVLEEAIQEWEERNLLNTYLFLKGEKWIDYLKGISNWMATHWNHPLISDQMIPSFFKNSRSEWFKFLFSPQCSQSALGTDFEKSQELNGLIPLIIHQFKDKPIWIKVGSNSDITAVFQLLLDAWEKKYGVIVILKEWINRTEEMGLLKKLLQILAELKINPDDTTSLFLGKMKRVYLVYHPLSLQLMQCNSQDEWEKFHGLLNDLEKAGFRAIFYSLDEFLQLPEKIFTGSFIFFWNCVYLTKQEHFLIRRLMQLSGYWVHFWANGLFIDGQMNLEEMQKTVGFPIQIYPQISKKVFSRSVWKMDANSSVQFPLIHEDQLLEAVIPGFVVRSPLKEEILAVDPYSWFVTMVVKKRRDRAWFYVAIPRINPEILHKLILNFVPFTYCFKGVHSWQGRDYLFLLPEYDGTIVFSPPVKEQVIDLWSGERIVWNEKSARIQCRRGIPILWYRNPFEKRSSE